MEEREGEREGGMLMIIDEGGDTLIVILVKLAVIGGRQRATSGLL